MFMARNSVTSYIINSVLRMATENRSASFTLTADRIQEQLPANLRADVARRGADQEVVRVLRYMQSQGLADYTEVKPGKYQLTLLERGKHRAEKSEFQQLRIPRPTRWDQRWRMVLFDVPETKKQARNALSLKLKSLGFQQVQKSAWVHPFPCLQEIERIKKEYGLEDHVTLMEVTSIDQHTRLVRQFQGLLSR